MWMRAACVCFFAACIPSQELPELLGDADSLLGDAANSVADMAESQSDGMELPPAPELNPHWIGGACAQSSDCQNGGTCVTNGFPNGFCTQACDPGDTCPDADISAATLNTVSRCVDGNGQAQCAAGCDCVKSPTGCRPDYVCVTR